MTSSNGNIFRVTGALRGEFTGPGEFPTQRQVTRNFAVFFDLRLNKRLSEQPWGWWFETLVCDISSNMNHDLSTDPNLNYNILHDHITKMKEKHLPFKFEKFNKHKHKNNKWISFGIIRSIKTRDAMYLKFKRCKQHNFEYHTLKNNLHVFNCILKKTIREAKIQYYDKLFPNTKTISRKHGKPYLISYANLTRNGKH